MTAADNSAVLLAALRRPGAYPHPVGRIDCIETHISWVFLTGSYVYKIKKPVDLGFLDFTTLAARRHFCEEELRLNRRLAPELYLDVVPIAGSAREPRVGGEGPPIEYAVRMKEFAQDCLLERAIAGGKVGIEAIEALARDIADFHAQLPAQPPDAAHDAGALVLKPALENFDQIQRLLESAVDVSMLAAIRAWTVGTFENTAAQFRERQARGKVRECHGDLHLGNIVLLDGRAVPFDCIEFNAGLRWVDVMSEVAFTMMDLEAHARRDLAHAFLSAYLETTGDYAGVAQLPFYIVYRAMVRAKIHLIRSSQSGLSMDARADALSDYRRYMAIAAAHARKTRGAVIITHGFSGSGKSTLARRLIASIGAIRVRSDVERKRRHGLGALARTNMPTGGGMYSEDETAQTYLQMLVHTRHIASAGFIAVADATFLKLVHRAAFHALAMTLDVPFAIIDHRVPDATLRARIASRAKTGGDASEATLQVLDAQTHAAEPLTEAEVQDSVVAIETVDSHQRVHSELVRRLNQPPASST